MYNKMSSCCAVRNSSVRDGLNVQNIVPPYKQFHYISLAAVFYQAVVAQNTTMLSLSKYTSNENKEKNSTKRGITCLLEAQRTLVCTITV